METNQPENNTDALFETTSKHLEKLLEQLDMSIARLALACGVSLDSEESINLAMRNPIESAHESSSEHEEQQLHEQLRGLLVLRYELEKRCVEEVGEQATRDLMAQAEAHLNALGFAPGSDGVEIDH